MALPDESDTSNMVLRTIFLPPALDDRLRDVAFSMRISKGDLIRQLVIIGLGATEAGLAGAVKPALRARAIPAPVGIKPRPAKKRVAPQAKKAITPKKSTAPKTAKKVLSKTSTPQRTG